MACYLDDGAGPEAQVSVYPDFAKEVAAAAAGGGSGTATKHTWYNSIPELEGRRDYDPAARLPGPPHDARADANRAFPLSECPDGCTGGQGVCFQWGWQRQRPNAKPACWCHKGFNGTSCATPDASEACWFAPDCGGHGTCVSGFCHCEPGRFGLGCARSAAFAVAPGAQPLASRVQLKIYMYELPWTVAFPFEFDDGVFGRDPM